MSDLLSRDKLLSCREVAEYLGISLTTLRSLIAGGYVKGGKFHLYKRKPKFPPAVTVGGREKFLASDIELWLRRQQRSF